MLNLPASTAFNRRIPKQKFYEELPLTPALRRVFVEQINAIWWRSKIAPATANLAPGRTVTELEVFELQLQKKNQQPSSNGDQHADDHHIFSVAEAQQYTGGKRRQHHHQCGKRGNQHCDVLMSGICLVDQAQYHNCNAINPGGK